MDEYLSSQSRGFIRRRITETSAIRPRRGAPARTALPAGVRKGSGHSTAAVAGSGGPDDLEGDWPRHAFTESMPVFPGGRHPGISVIRPTCFDGLFSAILTKAAKSAGWGRTRSFGAPIFWTPLWRRRENATGPGTAAVGNSVMATPSRRAFTKSGWLPRW